tara:strand:- start:68 stop:250 length:183 start_codon:yes stop_codon:yes gene_type:complete
MQTIDELTGLDCFQLKIEKEEDLVKVSILGPRDGEKAFVRIPGKALLTAVAKETLTSEAL